MTTSCEIFALRLHVKRKTNVKKGGNSKKKKKHTWSMHTDAALCSTHMPKQQALSHDTQGKDTEHIVLDTKLAA